MSGRFANSKKGRIFRTAQSLLTMFDFRRLFNRNSRADQCGSSPESIEWIPDWKRIIEREKTLWNSSRKSPKQKILIATATGGHPLLDAIESLLAVALSLRNAEVSILLCDGLPACLQASIDQFSDPAEFIANGPKSRLCSGCIQLGNTVFERTGLPLLKLSELISEPERDLARSIAASVPFKSIGSYELNGLKLGEQAMAGALRYFAVGSIDDQPNGEQVLRRFLESAILSAQATNNALLNENFDCVVLSHGVYVPHGAISEVTRAIGRRLVVWHLSYRDKCFIFSHDKIYFQSLLHEPTQNWENMPWTPEMEKEIMSYVSTRGQGIRDWAFPFQQDSKKEIAAISQEIGVDFSKPTIGLLTNVIWDAQLCYTSNAFPTMTEWVLQTIEYFSRRPDLQLVIRIHPGEVKVTMQSRQRCLDEIRNAFTVIPSNVFIVEPESKINSYVLMEQCSVSIIYGTTMGIELAAMGIPVILTGQSWLRNKGIAFDISTKQDYFDLLDKLPFEKKRMETQRTLRAKKYAYHYNYRCMLPIAVTERRDGWPPVGVRVASLTELLPGQDPGLDVACSGILDKTEFLFPLDSERSLIN